MSAARSSSMVSKGPRTTFGLAGNAVLDALVAKIADNLRFHHAIGGKVKLRTFASFMRLAAGLAYITTHYVNHSLANISVAAAESGLVLQKLIWQTLPGPIILYAALQLILVWDFGLFTSAAISALRERKRPSLCSASGSRP